MNSIDRLRVVSIVGARPNFMKVAPLVTAFQAHVRDVKHLLVHTGQHYDKRMSESFFSDLGMPKPDINLGIGSGSHAEQTGRVMMAIEPVLEAHRPDVMIVVGDVNSTIACALTAKKMGIRVVHVEAGLRSFDRTMPEELNRLCTDSISDLLFTTDHIANENLLREGVDESKIHFVGNVMIDSLMRHQPAANDTKFAESLGLKSKSYASLTLHRPANVDDRENLVEILDALVDGLHGMPVVFPAHPRTRRQITEFGLADRFTSKLAEGGIWMTEPLGYLEFLDVNSRARLVLTDSGGLQEETTILGVPCITIRENTERPITVTQGTNRLAGTSRQGILKAISEVFASDGQVSARPEKWDGQAATRIVDLLCRGA